MPTYRITAPDGRTFEVTAPEGATQDQVLEYAKKNAPQPSASMGQMLRKEAMESIPAGMIGGALRGAGSIGATLLRPFESGEVNKSRRDAMTNTLGDVGFATDSIPFGFGKILTEIGGTAGVGGLAGKLAAPFSQTAARALASSGMTTGLKPATLVDKAADLALRSGAGGVTGLLSAGLVNPEEADTGAAIGATLPGAAKIAGTIGGALGRSIVSNKNDDLARKAINEYGIPLDFASVKGGPMAKATKSILDDLMLTSNIGEARREAAQEGFNRAVGRQFGADAPSLTPDVVDAAKKKMGAEFTRIWGRNTLKIDPQFVQDLQQIQSDAVSKLNPEQAAQVNRQVQNLLQKAQGLDIDGAFANNWQSELRMAAESEKGLHQKVLTDLRKAALSAFNRSVSPEDAASLAMNTKQYKAFKTVEPLLRKSSVGEAGREIGNVPAALLPSAVAKSYSDPSSVPLGELAQIGSRYMVDRTPRTGGSIRAGLQNLGVLGGAAMGGVPAVAIGVPSALAAQAMLTSPKLAKAAVNAKGVPLNLLDDAALFGYRAAPIGLLGQ